MAYSRFGAFNSAMKLRFSDPYTEDHVSYQKEAIEAVCDLFTGQEINQTEFTVLRDPTDPQGRLAFAENDKGFGNRLRLLDDELQKNLSAIQIQNGLPPSSTLASGDFTVEMETGTGKTYVYLRTIFELNRRYGFTKFVIVVPSVAIKEGVYKTLQITEDHFRSLYSGTPCDYFLYDSSKLGQVRNFATSSSIQIMVVTVGAINKKDVNNLYKDSEKTGGEKPIDLIRATRPVLIVDEPQSVDGGLEGRGKVALAAMNPLCTLRYSATHAEKHHMVYKLDAVDAYERKLVKQIEVASATIQEAHNKPYVRFIAPVTKGKRVVGAKIEIDVAEGAGVRRRERSVEPNTWLHFEAGREIYTDIGIGEVGAAKGAEFLELRVPGDSIYLKKGEAYGDVDAAAVQREMIRRTIKEHLDKEKRLRPQGIKVLSLFFIDSVEKYRRYNADGRAEKGEYAQIFEEEYKRFAKHPDYKTLFEEVDLAHAAEDVHDGYFSIDKKGGWTDTSESNQTDRDNAERGYNLIMKDKEKLLSLSTPLKFIFSHSALREGWDNPNVFQICSLRNMGTERERRQSIGRGLRLCVNQEGERIRGFEINTLTVIANESFEQYAESLQTEVEKETGIRFGIVEHHLFAAIPIEAENGAVSPLGVDQSKALWEHLKAQGHINAQGKVQDTLRTALKDGSLALPEQFAGQRDQICGLLKKVAGRLEIKNADQREQIRLNKRIHEDAAFAEGFRQLWDRIKHKTTYRVEFDNEKLITDCITGLREAPKITKTRLIWRKHDLQIGRGGIDGELQETSAPIVLEEQDIELPDILTQLQDKTQLTRRTIYRILTESGRLGDFKKNPQQFIQIATEVINRKKKAALVDGIRYQRIGDEHYYAQELFQTSELTGYLKNLLTDAKKSVYEHVVCDAGTERSFAEQLELNEAVTLYVKLPGWFEVPTPLGGYNPDWAVLITKDGSEKLYFVVETKSTLFTDELRDKESGKIACAKVHFEAIKQGENPAQYVVERNVEEFLAAASEVSR
jgi:type III restriction enzyme